MWKLRSLRQWGRRTPDPGSDPADSSAASAEVAAMVRAAFPRPAASDALRARVAQEVSTVREAPAGSAGRQARQAPRLRLALAVTLLLLMILPMLALRKPVGIASAEASPTAGQLTILDARGEAAGLCPLKHTDVTADVAGYVARVTVTQEFRNPSAEAIEAIYTFPLPDDAAVDAMTMTVGDRVIRGEIKRREEAREIYEAAKSAGKAAALLDQERPNIFTQAVANIMPREKVSITISYVNLLKYDAGGYEFVFPMVVGPRFVAGSGGYRAPGFRGDPSPARQVEHDPGAEAVVTDAEKITPPIAPQGTRAGHDISVTVNINAGVPLAAIDSVLHPVAVERPAPAEASVRLRDSAVLPNKDFILRFGVAGEQLRAGVLAHAPGDGGGYFTLILQPPAAPPQADIAPKEMVFVIDQTGSQSGRPIEQAKETMRYCIQQLNPNDTFQLLGFNTDVYPCFPAPVSNTRENVRRALEYLDGVEAEGGTDILKAVDYALRIPSDPARLRMICYMTDGYVGNDMQIIDYVRKHRGTTRMFPFGIGNGVNRFLIEGMAREGRGAAEFVTLAESGKEKAARFYERIARPLLLDVQVDWNGLPVEDVFPRAIPDVFTSGPIILKGRYTRAAEGDLTVRGLLRGKPWSQTVRVAFPAVSKENSAVPTLWARAKIEDLQAEDWLGAQTGNPNPQITEQIVNLALDYRLMSQHTSFVAVEQRVVNVGGRSRTLDVPVEMPEGVSHEGIFGESGAGRLPLDMGALYHGRRFQVGGTYTAASSAPAAAPGPASVAQGEEIHHYGIPLTENLQGRYNGEPPEYESSRTTVPRVGREARSEPSAMKQARRRTRSVPNRQHAAAPVTIKSVTERLATEPRDAPPVHAKIAPALNLLIQPREAPAGVPRPEVKDGRVEVQVWLDALPADGQQKLRALGFELAATLRPGRLLLGTVAVERLEALAALPWVRRVEPPRFR